MDSSDDEDDLYMQTNTGDWELVKKIQPKVIKTRATGAMRKYTRKPLDLNLISSSEDEIPTIATRKSSRKLRKLILPSNLQEEILNVPKSDKRTVKKTALADEQLKAVVAGEQHLGTSSKRDEIHTAPKSKKRVKPKKKTVIADKKAICKRKNKSAKADEQLGGVQHDTDIVTNDPDTDPLFECGCCYNEVPFDYMVQCLDGHLFCCWCLELYTKEAVYGHGKGELVCLNGDCDFTFPISQLIRALPESLYTKYEERMTSECLNTVAMENLVMCKFCNYGAILEPDETYFKCHQCLKQFCRKCGELYQDHQGLNCDQVEKDEETKLRIQYEEKQAEAKIRTCDYCKSRFTKDSGCNKMVCRCGKSMCYVCRKPNINYNHYCQHLRDPDIKGCLNCNSCFLWSNADEDDRMAIEEIKKEANQALEKGGFTINRQIGATVSPARNIQASQNNRANVERQIIDQRALDIVPQLAYPAQNVAMVGQLHPQPILAHIPPPALPDVETVVRPPAHGSGHQYNPPQTGVAGRLGPVLQDRNNIPLRMPKPRWKY